MVFFVLTGGIVGNPNLLVPFRLARDMAFGLRTCCRTGCSFALVFRHDAFTFVEAGPASAGWTIYPPLSALPQAIPSSGLGMTLWLVSMVLFIASALLGGINYVVTILNLRTKGHEHDPPSADHFGVLHHRYPRYLSFPVLFAAALLLLFDRSFGTSFYLSISSSMVPLAQHRWQPVLFQHLFWFLRSPGGIHRPVAGARSGFQSLRPSLANRSSVYKGMIGSMLVIAFLVYRVGSPHVYHRYEPVPRIGVRIHDPAGRYSFRGKGLQLPGDTLAWKHRADSRHVVRHRSGIVLHFGWSDRIILGDSALDINVPR